MSVPVRRTISPEQYLAFEAASTTKHEYVDGVVYPWGDPDHPLEPEIVLGSQPEPPSAMAGGTRALHDQGEPYGGYRHTPGHGTLPAIRQ